MVMVMAEVNFDSCRVLKLASFSCLIACLFVFNLLCHRRFDFVSLFLLKRVQQNSIRFTFHLRDTLCVHIYTIQRSTARTLYRPKTKIIRRTFNYLIEINYCWV